LVGCRWRKIQTLSTKANCPLYWLRRHHDECADDQEAVEKAKRFIDGRHIELWEKSRYVVRFARTSGK